MLNLTNILGNSNTKMSNQNFFAGLEKRDREREAVSGDGNGNGSNCRKSISKPEKNIPTAHTTQKKTEKN